MLRSLIAVPLLALAACSTERSAEPARRHETDPRLVRDRAVEAPQTPPVPDAQPTPPNPPTQPTPPVQPAPPEPAPPAGEKK